VLTDAGNNGTQGTQGFIQVWASVRMKTQRLVCINVLQFIGLRLGWVYKEDPGQLLLYLTRTNSTRLIYKILSVIIFENSFGYGPPGLCS
jgi:hypothetical protein